MLTDGVCRPGKLIGYSFGSGGGVVSVVSDVPSTPVSTDASVTPSASSSSLPSSSSAFPSPFRLPVLPTCDLVRITQHSPSMRVSLSDTGEVNTDGVLCAFQETVRSAEVKRYYYS